MASNQPQLSPQLLKVLFEDAAQGRVKASALLSVVKTETPLIYNDSSVVFTKHAPGNFTVTMKRDDNEIGTAHCATPTEAKLVALEYIIGAAGASEKKGKQRELQAA